MSVPFTSLNRLQYQANLVLMVSKLNVRLSPKPKRWDHPDYQIGRLRVVRNTVTELVRYERIEANKFRAEFSREYVERLISEAVRWGDCHKPTMDLANWWLTDKTLVPKLFKVLAERYRDWPVGLPYTRLLRAPKPIIPQYDEGNPNANHAYERAVLELKGNPYPPLPGPFQRNSNPGLLHNILLEEARKDYFRSQSKIQQKVERQVPEDDEGVLQSTSGQQEVPTTQLSAIEQK